MSNIAFSHGAEIHDPVELPPRWLDCPRKSTIIADKFIAFKTPLDDRYKSLITPDKRWTCSMLIKHVKDDEKNLGLVIDLTNTTKYYRSDSEFIEKNIRYEKLACQGHNGPPNDQQIQDFIKICRDFIQTNPNHIIGVHCTHGLNRTGFLICAYLCQELHYRIDFAIDLFAKARSTGIYKQQYLDILNQVYGRPRSSVSPTEKKRLRNDIHDESSSPKRFRESNSKPKFVVNLRDVNPVDNESIVNSVRSQCQVMCGWKTQSFPGSQPVSMDYTNYKKIFLSPYMVSWKADGTRYMMLIENENQIYMLDRNNDVFQVNNLTFLKSPNDSRHLVNTLLDGEFVIDNDNGNLIYRYLIYDVIICDNEYVCQKSFEERLAIIQNNIVGVRNEAIKNGRIDRNIEPFSIRMKPFWDLSHVNKLLSPEFQSQITHGCDGLIFQPVSDNYKPGRSENVLKWKEDNTIDFRLKIERTRQSQKLAYLYVTKMSGPYATMPYSPQLEQYKNQIIECSYCNGVWKFFRHRSDKTYPNAKDTADAITNGLQRPITKEILCSYIKENQAFVNLF